MRPANAMRESTRSSNAGKKTPADPQSGPFSSSSQRIQASLVLVGRPLYSLQQLPVQVLTDGRFVSVKLLSIVHRRAPRQPALELARSLAECWFSFRGERR